jgi:hypothetical protein
VSAAAPPRLAVALLERLAPRNEALAGDLAEEFRLGRSRTWYWRQVLAAVAAEFTSGVRAQPVLVARALVTGWLTLRVIHLVTSRLPLLDWFLDPVIMAFGSHPFVMLWAVQLWFRPIEAAGYLIAGWLVGVTHPNNRRTAVVAFTLLLLVLSAWETAYRFWHDLVWITHRVPDYWGLSLLFALLPLLALVGGLSGQKADSAGRRVA